MWNDSLLQPFFKEAGPRPQCLLGDGIKGSSRTCRTSRESGPAHSVTLAAPSTLGIACSAVTDGHTEGGLNANEECTAVVLRWCGLRDYNTVGRFSSLPCASECVRVLAASGFTETSISAVAL